MGEESGTLLAMRNLVKGEANGIDIHRHICVMTVG